MATNNIFDASTITYEVPEISKEEFVAELLPKIKNIVMKAFPNNPRRHTIKVFKDRISFCAPCCGDSAKSDFKRRGNIILEGRFKNLYKCHNCGVSMSLNKFLREYGESMSLSAVNYITTTTTQVDASTMEASTIDALYDTDTISKLAVNREFFKSSFGLVECNVNNPAHQYLVSRNQYDFRKFLYSPGYNLLFILNITKDNNIFGMQVHHLDKDYKGPKYKTYSLAKIHSDFLHSDVSIPDDINSMSMIFNILLIDCNRYVTVTEGPMDSFLIKNSIALCGAGKHMDFVFACRYMYDDDAAGRKHALEKINQEEYVFLWDTFKRDLGLPKKRKYDMNDVVNWCMANSVKIPQIDGYFSNDPFDIIEI